MLAILLGLECSLFVPIDCEESIHRSRLLSTEVDVPSSLLLSARAGNEQFISHHH